MWFWSVWPAIKQIPFHLRTLHSWSKAMLSEDWGMFGCAWKFYCIVWHLHAATWYRRVIVPIKYLCEHWEACNVQHIIICWGKRRAKSATRQLQKAKTYIKDMQYLYDHLWYVFILLEMFGETKEWGYLAFPFSNIFLTSCIFVNSAAQCLELTDIFYPSRSQLAVSQDSLHIPMMLQTSKIIYNTQILSKKVSAHSSK